MSGYTHPAEQLNWPHFDVPAIVTEGLSMQRAMLNSAIEFVYTPFLAQASHTSTENLLAANLNAKLVDPALSFTRAVETAEPLFDILSDEEL